MKGADGFLKMNPPPILDTIESFYMSHFMALLSEVNDRSLPITRVILYAQMLGIEDINLFLNIMMDCYGVYFKGVNDMIKKTQGGKKK